MIISAPPPDGFPSGLLSLQIHNITGLELDKLSKRQAEDDDEASDEEETGESLHSSYCTIIVNHSKTFKTRTKPQNAKPFFNAGCERFVRDWRECEVFVSVRDARLHEDNPLLGIVHLPLGDVFKERSQVMGFWPLTGGIGHGRIRLSLGWRSVQLQVPRNLLGWNYGTVDVQPLAVSQDCPEDLRTCKLKLKTDISMGKLYSQGGGEARWTAKKEQRLSLAVRRRYSSCMSIAFKDRGFFGDKVAAFCVLWLKDIPDEEEEELELTIWKGDFERATACCLEECGEKVGTLKLKMTFWAGMVSRDTLATDCRCTREASANELPGLLRGGRILDGHRAARTSAMWSKSSTRRGTTLTRTRCSRKQAWWTTRHQATATAPTAPRATTYPTAAPTTSRARWTGSGTTGGETRLCIGSTGASCNGR